MTKQFKETAASYDMYQKNNLPEYALKDHWFKDRLKDYNDKFEGNHIPQDLKNIEGVEVGIFGEVTAQYYNNSDEVELYYIENFYTLVYINGQVFRLQRYKEQYTLQPMYKDIINSSRCINNYQKMVFTDKVKQPNKIGVFTLKKVNDWVKYSNEYINALRECSEHISAKKNENQKVIDDFINSLPQNKIKISKYHNQTDIYCSMFDIQFNLLDNGTYLDKKITYKGGLDNVIKIENS